MLYGLSAAASVWGMSALKRLPLLLIACVLVPLSVAEEIRDFKVVVKRIEEGKIRYYHQSVSGIERSNTGLNRSGLGSESQLDYPDPESGCGPTALLNILIWYEKYGLIEAQSREANPQRYKQQLFGLIDRQIADVAAISRTSQQGTNSPQIGIALDQLVQAGSKNQLRIHTDFRSAPLQTSDFLEITKQFRAGYLVVRPQSKGNIHVPENEDHAVTVLRCDRMGNITLSTWGKIYRGRLKMRGEEQWFIPSNSKHLEMRIKSLVQFIPFKPVTTAADR